MNENNNENNQTTMNNQEVQNTVQPVKNNSVYNQNNKKGNGLIIALVIIIILLIGIIGLLLYLKNDENSNSTTSNGDSNETTAEAKIDFGNSGKIIIVYDDKTEKVKYSEDYKTSDGEKLAEYSCTGGCAFTESYTYSAYENTLSDNDNSSSNDNVGGIYIYDDGKVLKYDSDTKEFNQINVSSKVISLTEYNTVILYFEDDDAFGSFQLDTDNYSYDYNKDFIENGYIIVSTNENYDYNYHIYDYKNNITKYKVEHASSYVWTYENFIVVSDLGIFTNDLTKISDDYDFCGYGGCNISVTEDYVYIPNYDNGSINVYDKNGNVTTISDYSYVLTVYDKYAYVLDSSLDLKVIDMSLNKVLADFNITLSDTRSGQTWELENGQIWFSNEECRADSENTLWYYYDVNTGEFGSTDYINSICS